MDTEYLEMESPLLQVATKDKIEYEQASQNNSSTNTPNNERLPSPVGGQSLNLDTVIQAQNSLMRCHNCLIRIKKLKRYNLQDPDILSVIQRWSHPRKASSDSIICYACWQLALEQVENPSKTLPTTVGHKLVCICCGRSYLRQTPSRYSTLKAVVEKNIFMREFIAKAIFPYPLTDSDHIVCHVCKIRADRAQKKALEASEQADNQRELNIDEQNYQTGQQNNQTGQQNNQTEEQNNQTKEQTNQTEEQNNQNKEQKKDETIPSVPEIHLPNYAKAPDSQEGCSFPKCEEKKCQIISRDLRVKIFCDHNFYIPSDNKVCETHTEWESWASLLEVLVDPVRTFSALDIEDAALLLKTS